MAATELLSYLSAVSAPPSPEELCAFVVRSCGAERGFLVLDAPSRRIWAVDLDGFALGHGHQRIPVELLPEGAGDVVRRTGKSAGLGLSLRTGTGLVTLILEHRFRRYPLDHLTDVELQQWLLALAVGLRWILDSSAATAVSPPQTRGTPKPPVLARPGLRKTQPVIGAAEQVELDDSLLALQQEDWNISRAARRLGMTRHGLKKRMRRLGIERPASA